MNITRFSDKKNGDFVGPQALGPYQLNGSVSSPLLRKVLIVDDERDLADLTAFLLNYHGLEAVVAYSAVEALQVLQDDHKIDVVVSDIKMPEMNGLQLAGLIDVMYPRIKVILVSGYTQSGVFGKYHRAFLFTEKPYKIETILKLIHT